jgi:chaperonin GroES
MKIQPLNDWAVVIPSEAAFRTAGGIYIPDSAKEKPAEGVVEAIGPGAYEEEKRGKKKDGKKERKFVPTSVKPGDRVIYERYAGQKIELGGVERVLVREISILGTLPAKPAEAGEDLPPLMLPAATSPSQSTALAARKPSAVMARPETRKTEVKAAPKKQAKKAAAKPKKATPKKSATKKAKKKR